MTKCPHGAGASKAIEITLFTSDDPKIVAMIHEMADKDIEEMKLMTTGGDHDTSTSTDMKKVTGIGGIFFTSSNREALMDWYRDHLGIQSESWGGVI